LYQQIIESVTFKRSHHNINKAYAHLHYYPSLSSFPGRMFLSPATSIQQVLRQGIANSKPFLTSALNHHH